MLVHVGAAYRPVRVAHLHDVADLLHTGDSRVTVLLADVIWVPNLECHETQFLQDFRMPETALTLLNALYSSRRKTMREC